MARETQSKDSIRNSGLTLVITRGYWRLEPGIVFLEADHEFTTRAKPGTFEMKHLSPPIKPECFSIDEEGRTLAGGKRFRRV